MNEQQQHNNAAKDLNNSSYLKFFFILNVFVILCVINPWVYGLRLGAFIFLCIEIIMILLISIPSFFYQLLINKKSPKESLGMAITSFFNIISHMNGAIF
ncbi:MAG: hypothetical protein PHY54_09445 [Methylococcales bacterium]|nr:hypothetical protein [Methylococcales bacterium]